MSYYSKLQTLGKDADVTVHRRHAADVDGDIMSVSAEGVELRTHTPGGHPWTTYIEMSDICGLEYPPHKNT